MDVEGTILETPAEPPNSVFRNKIKHSAYRTHEAAGIIWTYMGPTDAMPAVPNYEFMKIRSTEVMQPSLS
jgi:phthalate 4,5-dioxygenase oxygenase subunit